MGQVLFAPALAGCTSDDVTASAAQVLSGYTALTKDSNDDPISGTMTNRGAWTSSSSGSGHIAIPAGYHNGSGYVDCSGAYNAGVTDADARTNTSSANYQAGYNSGKSGVTLSASASGRTVTATASNGKTASASVAYAGSNGVVSVSTSGGSGNQSFNITDGWCTSINVDRTGAYNKGVSDADARANTSSANYQAGYNAGKAVAKTANVNVSGSINNYGDYNFTVYVNNKTACYVSGSKPYSTGSSNKISGSGSVSI